MDRLEEGRIHGHYRREEVDFLPTKTFLCANSKEVGFDYSNGQNKYIRHYKACSVVLQLSAGGSVNLTVISDDPSQTEAVFNELEEKLLIPSD